MLLAPNSKFKVRDPGRGKLRLALFLVALAIAAGGQFCLAGHHLLWGLVLYGAAVVTGIFAVADKAQLTDLRLEGLRPLTFDSRRKARKLLPVVAGFLAVALALCGLSLWYFGKESNSPSGWPPFLAGLAAMVVVVLLLGGFQARGEEPAGGRDSSLKKTDLILVPLILSVVLGVALYLRTFRLGSLPYGLWVDEAMHGLSAIEILSNSSYRPVYVPFVHLPSPLVYMQALSVKWLGQTTFALRLPAAILGTMTVWLFFLLARELFNSRVALVGAFLMAVSFWFILWGRSGMPGVTVPFVTVLATLFLIRALRYGRLPDYLWAGLAFGATAWFYTALLLFPLVGALLSAYLVISRPRLVRRAWPGLALCAAVALLAASPIVEYMWLHHGEFWERTEAVAVFRGKPLSQSLRDVGDNLRLHLLMFNYEGDPVGRHNLPGKPLLDFVTGVLAVLGLAYCVRHVTRPRSLLLVLWFVLMLVPAVFSQRAEAPHSLRAVGTLPAVYLLALVPIHRIGGLWDTPNLRSVRPVFTVLLVVGLVAVGYLNYAQYFQRYSDNRIVWEDFSAQGTYLSYRLAELESEGIDVYTTPVWNLYPIRKFLAPGSRPPQVIGFPEDLPVTMASRDALLFVDPKRGDIWERVQQCYPGAEVSRFQGPDADALPLLYVLDLNAGQLRQGLERCPRPAASPSERAASEGSEDCQCW